MGQIKKSYSLEFKHHVVEKFEQGATYNEINKTPNNEYARSMISDPWDTLRFKRRPLHVRILNATELVKNHHTYQQSKYYRNLAIVLCPLYITICPLL